MSADNVIGVDFGRDPYPEVGSLYVDIMTAVTGYDHLVPTAAAIGALELAKQTLILRKLRVMD